MPSDYYTYLGKEVYDNDVARADDLNTINTAVDAAFEQVETDVDTFLSESQFYSTKAQEWAENPFGVEVMPGQYSALHWATESADSADAASISETNAADSADAASISETNAAASEAACSAIENVLIPFNSIASMLSSNLTSGINYKILGYYVPGDGGGGYFLYKAGDFSSEVAADTMNGIYVTSADDPTGASGVWERENVSEWNGLWFGMDPSSVTDSGPGLRGIASLAEHLGGATVNIPQGKYRLASIDTYEFPKDEFSVACFGSNVHLKGLGECELWLDGATIDPLMGSGLRFNALCIKMDERNSSIKGFKFTTNGWVLVTDFESCNGVVIGGDYCEASDNWFYNMPGRNMLYIGYNNPSWPAFASFPQGTIARRNIFENGADVVPGNTVSVDCGFLYNNGFDSLIEENVFTNSELPDINCSAVENHNGRNIIRGNYFKNVWPGVYLGVEGGIIDGLVVEDNYFEECIGGVQTLQSTVGCVIRDNFFHNLGAVTTGPLAGSKPIFSTLAGVTGIADAILDGMVISGNHFLEDTPLFASAVRVGALKNSMIHSNTFSGFSECITIASASNYDTFNVSVFENNCSNFPTGVGPYTQGVMTIGGEDSWASNIDNIHFFNNSMMSEVATTSIQEYVSYGSMNVQTNCDTRNTYSSNIITGVGGSAAAYLTYPVYDTDPVFHTSSWFQYSGTPQPSLGNGVLLVQYKKVERVVTVNFYFEAGSTTTFGNSSSGWQFSLPYASVLSMNQYMTLIMNTGGNDYTLKGVIGASESTINFAYSSGLVRSDFPAVHGVGTSIRGSFSYYAQ